MQLPVVVLETSNFVRDLKLQSKIEIGSKIQMEKTLDIEKNSYPYTLRRLKNESNRF